MKSSNKDDISNSWVLWQFYEMPKFLLEVWKNYFIFASNLFSLTLLLNTFFAPWRKYSWSYPKSFDLKEFLNTLVGNLISRILGAIMRTVLIIIGIFFQFFVTIVGSIFFIGWLSIPLIVAFGLLFILFY
jgi:hypothetical protein